MSLGGFGSCCPNDNGMDQTWLCLTCEPKQWLLGLRWFWSLPCWHGGCSRVSFSRRNPASPWLAWMGSGTSRWRVSPWTVVSQTSTMCTQPPSTAARGPPLARNAPSLADLLLFWKVLGVSVQWPETQLTQTAPRNTCCSCCWFRIIHDILSRKNYGTLWKVYLY